MHANNVVFMNPGEEIAIGNGVTGAELMEQAKAQGLNVTGLYSGARWRWVRHANRTACVSIPQPDSGGWVRCATACAAPWRRVGSCHRVLHRRAEGLAAPVAMQRHGRVTCQERPPVQPD